MQWRPFLHLDLGTTHVVNTLTSGIRPFLVLTALCAALFLPGLSSVPPTDRDEARFMQATKQMLETGDVVNIRFQAEPRTKKPVGIHWLQYLSVKYVAQRDLAAVWAYRLPSTLAAWLSVLCVFVFGRALFSAHTGLIAAGLTACTFLMTTEAHLAKTDAMLLLTVITAHMALFEFYRAKPGIMPPMKVALLFWCAIGVGLLIKGPITLAIVVATAFSLSVADKKIIWLRGLQPEIGIPLAIAFILPWMLASIANGQGGVITTSLAEDFLPKLFTGTEGHGALPGTHSLLSPATLWPASLLLIPGLLLAWKHRHETNVRYCLAWGLSTWALFEVIPTKLPHYVLPAVPALALAAAEALSRANFEIPRWSVAVWSLVAAVLGGGILWATHIFDGSTLPAIALSTALVISTIFIWMRPSRTLLALPLTAVVSFGLIVGIILPGLNGLALSSRIARLVDQHTSVESPAVALTRYHEPSAVFMLGTETWLTDGRNAAAHISADPLALAVVAADQLESIDEILASTQATMIVIDKIDGYNYSKGRRESLSLIRSEPRNQAK
jgi:4-amino-4-deoxy-L-arabinose transferase-like glycosyltransferase